MSFWGTFSFVKFSQFVLVIAIETKSVHLLGLLVTSGIRYSGTKYLQVGRLLMIGLPSLRKKTYCSECLGTEVSFTLTQSSLVNSVLWSGNLELGSWLSARIRWRWCRHPLIQVFLKQCNVCALCSFSCESRLCGDSNAESFQIFNSLILFASQSHCRPFWRMGPSESLSDLCQYKRLISPQIANM